MNKLAALALPLLALATPAMSADLERSTYYRETDVVRERGVVVEAPAPVVERRVVERRYYYAPAPVVTEDVVVAPRYRIPRVWANGYVGRADFGEGWGGPRRLYDKRRVYYGYGPAGYYGYRRW